MKFTSIIRHIEKPTLLTFNEVTYKTNVKMILITKANFEMDIESFVSLSSIGIGEVTAEFDGLTQSITSNLSKELTIQFQTKAKEELLELANIDNNGNPLFKF